jgi:hypothetical protein
MTETALPPFEATPAAIDKISDLAMLYPLSYSGEYVDSVSARYAADAHPRPLGLHLTS